MELATAGVPTGRIHMSDPNAGLADALKLEDIHFTQWITESSLEVNEKIRAAERNLAARGLALSGMRYKGEVDIIFTSIEAVVDKAVTYRRELGAKVPALLEPGKLKVLKDKLDRHIDSGVKGATSRVKAPMEGAVSSALAREAEQRAAVTKVRLARKLEALPLEARLGMHQAGGATVNTFNISNSTIANLNLGTVVGDLNSSIQQLNVEGRKELAEEFRKMTEALGSSQELNDDARKEMLEHLSVVSDESTKPPEQRKMGPLKSSLVALKSGIGVAAQLLGIYQGLEHALKASGIIPG
jgi:hypothetical protein